MDTVAVQDLPESWHRETAAMLRAEGLACGVHLPFFDLHPGSFNDAILAASRETLRRAAALASLYAPHHMIGHVSWDGSQHGADAARWLERSAGMETVTSTATCRMFSSFSSRCSGSPTRIW